MRQSVQPVFEPDHALSQTHRLQTFRLRSLRSRLPAQGRPPEAQGNATHRTQTYRHLVPNGRKRPVAATQVFNGMCWTRN
ncbi:unnamed protein product [Acanthoscelides obtectus]|uniref:Uncharacterized protein n=1 Tax=Acanthoscelides obtectus TaxID=200917 RepID=A0A9P0Q5F4_ACAOB|nr:unnamed protein product [Acanthoscelides obtectus]CAK1645079.1 hypothetical protein AOBTE_LOCUS14016 [Acanthoscelides obtectus]